MCGLELGGLDEFNVRRWRRLALEPLGSYGLRAGRLQ
jgi:hypothetical protein